MSIYDGLNASTPLIGQYCGQQRNLVVYSTKNFLFVTFDTLPRAANTQNRGFKGMFEFSESFVKLGEFVLNIIRIPYSAQYHLYIIFRIDFIGINDGVHVRGTECDQKVLSKRTSTGYIFSPNYPFPYIPKIVCRYFVYGLEGAQDLERVRLEFIMFDIPKAHQNEQE